RRQVCTDPSPVDDFLAGKIKTSSWRTFLATQPRPHAELAIEHPDATAQFVTEMHGDNSSEFDCDYRSRCGWRRQIWTPQYVVKLRIEQPGHRAIDRAADGSSDNSITGD